MSDTPRTDGVMREGPIEAGAAWREMRDFARTLERELNEAREELCELRKWQADHRADVEAKDAKIDALERSLKALRKANKGHRVDSTAPGEAYPDATGSAHRPVSDASES